MIDKARVLYRQGLSTRDISELIDRSHTWVWSHVKDLLEVDKSEKKALSTGEAKEGG